MIQIIRSDTPVDVTLCEKDKITSITENIALLLSTRKGTIPMYREFGLPMEFIDKPIDVAKTLMVAEISEALEEFEPRAKLINIEFESNIASPGVLTAIVEVEI